jgi:hypothetical protein
VHQAGAAYDELHALNRGPDVQLFRVLDQRAKDVLAAVKPAMQGEGVGRSTWYRTGTSRRISRPAWSPSSGATGKAGHGARLRDNWWGCR